MSYSETRPVTNKAMEIAKQREAIGGEIKRMAEKNQNEFTAEDEQSWQRANAEFDELSRKMQAVERKYHAEKIDEELNRKTKDDAKWIKRAGGFPGMSWHERERVMSRAMVGWLKQDNRMQLNDGDFDAMRQCNINPHQKELVVRMMPDQPTSKEDIGDWVKLQRDLSIGTETSTVSGFGNLAPFGFVRALEEALLAYFPALAVCDVLRTENGNLLPWPTINDTTNKGALLSEAGSVGSSVDPTASEIKFSAYKISSTLVKVSAETLEDNFLGEQLAARIGRWLGTRIARKVADFVTNGTGSSQPQGFIPAANIGATSGASAAIALADIIKLNASLDPEYITNAKYMCHNSILWYLRGLTDTTGRSLFWAIGNDSLASAYGNNLMGRELVVNQSMDATVSGVPVTGKKHLAFGDFSKIMVRWVRDIRFYQLNELYRANDQTGFIAFARMDSNLLDAGTHPLQILAQP